MNRILLVGALAALAALALPLQAQNRNPPRAPTRPKPQKPIDVPPAVVVLQVDTTEGDSTRAIIKRDFDYGDRIQPLILDNETLADIWKPGDRRIGPRACHRTAVDGGARGLDQALQSRRRRSCRRSRHSLTGICTAQCPARATLRFVTVLAVWKTCRIRQPGKPHSVNRCRIERRNKE